MRADCWATLVSGCIQATWRGTSNRAGPEISDKTTGGSLARMYDYASRRRTSNGIKRRTERNHTLAFRAQIALAALKSDKTPVQSDPSGRPTSLLRIVVETGTANGIQLLEEYSLHD